MNRTIHALCLLLLVRMPSPRGQSLPGDLVSMRSDGAAALGAEQEPFFLGDVFLASLRPQRGDRIITPPETKPVEPKPSEWFGGEPWWRWSRLTGDWAGRRGKLEDAGLDLGGDYTLDWSTALSGGLVQRGVARGLLDVHFAFDPQPLAGIAGGKLFAQYFFRHGPNGSDDIGDLQGFSNIDAERLSKAEEFWYEQRLFGDRIRVKAGQVDANAEFDFVEAGAEFLISSAGYSPTLLALPTYPDPRLSLNLFVYPVTNLYIGAGVYGESAEQGASFSQPFWIGEVGVTKPASEKWGSGRVALGGWHNSATLDRFDGSRQCGASGFYAVAEQRLWREKPSVTEDKQGLSLFVQYGYGDQEVSAFAHHASVGLFSVGALPGRDNDCAGVSFSYAGLSHAAGAAFAHDESVVEWFCRFQITPFLSVKPDVQWIHHPGGSDCHRDAVVGTLRITVDF